METLMLSIVTPYGKIYDGAVESVVMPGSEGEFGVYPGHCNLLSSLKTGVIEICKSSGDLELVAINWGYAEVSPHKVDVIADGAVSINGSDEDQVATAIENARKLLEEASNDHVAISSVVSRIEAAARIKF
ncbi:MULTISPECIES: ATP synthase F1 subunit epsilon [Helicobacter]|uniref:ATP synthase epsilon chain n=1 Tax=Helicobacter equorum TaxID=361872 RepID=A0A3D8ISN5_9HELI|nr:MULTISPECIES: ATP synthase F1 subunit epsilon [Helicobacter]MBR2111823.1 F0F1 ATP synthase subunit epsilon [Helicobacter sp.]MCI6313244.1 F0F1 ATP synthase subunit epsilon [Helicobacter sp.]MCI7711317.1 F0F1 ATP synthase subunit epsilon [Helicobacter sp.]MDD7345565.1 ATP synthase F1 subunit epsilon [Helicobacter sp.]MDY2823802.1 ATP synthase F1 subunit epsilon [Helicobacter sp.]